MDGATVSDTGSGLTDVPAALAAAVVAEPATLAARTTYPNTSAEPQSRELTWTNTTDKPVRLRLSAGPGSAVRLDAQTLNVPARSSAVSKVTLEPSRVEAGTTYGGAVTATWPGGGRATVPVSIQADPETYTLTLTGPAPREGSAATSTGVVLQNEKTGASQVIGLTGTTPKKVTLPRGSYRALGHTWEYDKVGNTVVGSTAIHFARRVTVDQDTSVALDTKDAKPVRIGVDDGSARVTLQSATGTASRIDTGSGAVDTGLIAPSCAGQYRVEAVPTTGAALDGLTFFGGLSWQQREVDAHEPGSSPNALKLLLSQYSIYRWLGTATGEVVDIGTGADTDPAAMDLKGKITVFSDAAGHRAETAPGADSGSTVLADDSGKVLARNAAPGRATFDLPRKENWYRLTVDATRTPPDPVAWMLGTRITSEWRLRSGHENPAAPARLLDLDYRLPLTGENAADPAKPLDYTVGLSAQGSRKALPIASLKVWYATDGSDWKQAAAARGADGRWKVTVPALGTAKVDLRSTVTDTSGASLTETLIDAYNSGCADIWC
ncbi:hypothetical protein [Streptomyces atratus]